MDQPKQTPGTETTQHETYAGPNRVEALLGKAKLRGFIGGITGNVVGAIGGALVVKPEGKMARYAEGVIDKLPTMVKKHLSGRSAVMVGLAVAGGYIGHKAGVIWGAATHWEDSKQGEVQFNRIIAERDAARAQLTTLQSHIDALASTSKETHAADYLAQKHETAGPSR